MHIRTWTGTGISNYQPETKTSELIIANKHEATREYCRDYNSKIKACMSQGACKKREGKEEGGSKGRAASRVRAGGEEKRRHGSKGSGKANDSSCANSCIYKRKG